MSTLKILYAFVITFRAPYPAGVLLKPMSHTFTRTYVHFAYVHDTSMAFKRISLLWSAKGAIMGHVGDRLFCLGKKPISSGNVGDTAFFARAKNHVTTFGTLGGLAVDSAYNIK